MFRFHHPCLAALAEPRLDQLVRIWWLRTWRGAAGGVIAVAPFAAGFYFLQRAGIASLWLKAGFQILILLIGSAIAYGVSRMALAKRYADFRIALLPPEGGPELAVTNGRVLSFWWLLVWRVTLGAAVITLAGQGVARLLPPDTKTIREVIVVLAIIAWEFWVLRTALTKRYHDFRIALVAGDGKSKM